MQLLAVVLSVLIPVVAFAVNWGMRASMGYALSAAADFVLAVVVFDFGAIVTHKLFEGVAFSPFVQANFEEIFECFFLVTALLWGAYFLRTEDKITKLYQQLVTPKNTIERHVGISWALVFAIVASHVFTFVYA